MSRQLAELDKLKAEFVSVASHELKTPINVILGYLQLMQEGIYGPLSTKQSEILDTIEPRGSTLRARRAAARREPVRGRRRTHRAATDPPRPPARRARARVPRARGAARRSSSVSARGDGLPEEVQWDLDRINEVMGNLLANAFKFTPHGGTVELSVEPVGRRREDRGARHRRGDSAGPAAAHLREVLPGRQSGRGVGDGTGLGLAIAKEIVEAHRGQIRCDSTLGGGRRSRSSCRPRCASAGAPASTASSSSRRFRDATDSGRTRPGRAPRRLGLPAVAQSSRPAHAAPTAAAEWPAALLAGGGGRERGRFGAADRVLPSSRSASRGRRRRRRCRTGARYSSSTRRTPRRIREAMALLESYLADTRPPARIEWRRRALRAARLALEQRNAAIAAHPARAHGATGGKARDEELKRLRDELAKANAELERIRRRLARRRAPYAHPTGTARASARSARRARAASARSRAARARDPRQQPIGGIARRLVEQLVAQRVGDAEGRHAALPLAEQIAHAPHPQILTRDHESVVAADEDSSRCFVSGSRRREDAVRRLRAAADAAAQLVQLRQPEPLRVLDQHHRRVRRRRCRPRSPSSRRAHRSRRRGSVA